MLDKIITDFVKKTSIEIKKKKNKDLIEKEIVEPVLKILLNVYILMYLYCLLCIL